MSSIDTQYTTNENSSRPKAAQTNRSLVTTSTGLSSILSGCVTLAWKTLMILTVLLD